MRVRMIVVGWDRIATSREKFRLAGIFRVLPSAETCNRHYDGSKINAYCTVTLDVTLPPFPFENE